jgi:hypothetical protein
MTTRKRGLWLLGLFLLILPSASVLCGQVKVETVNRAVGSVAITAGVDIQSVRSRMSETALQAALPALPYSALVTNSGQSTAVLFVVDFQFLRPDGRVSGSLQVRDYRSTEGKLVPGSSQVIDPFGWLARYLSPASPAAGIEDPRYPNFLAQLNAIKNLSVVKVSLDAVLFDNGQFAGPDTANTFGALTAEKAAFARLFNTLQSMSDATDAQILDALKGIAATAENEAGTAKTPNDTRIHSRVASRASVLAQTLQNQGRMAFNQSVAAYHEPTLFKEAVR